MTHPIVILNDDSIARGGTAVLALMSAFALAERGHRVTWVTGDAGANPGLAEAGIEVVALGSRPLLELPAREALRKGISNPGAAGLVARMVAERDTPDTVWHVHSWAQILSPAIFASLAPVAGRTLLHAHDHFLACPNGVFMDYRHGAVCERVPLSASCIATNCDKRSYAQKLWRVARSAGLKHRLSPMRRWGGVLLIHEVMRARFLRAGYPDHQLHILRNPVVPFAPERVRAEENDRLLYVGRLEEDKGVGDLVAAATRAGVPLTLVGDGPLRDRIAAEAPGVELAGWVDKPGLAAYAARARALVMPSRHPEPFGLVIAEAAASGLPVLASNSAAIAGEVEAAGLGYAFAPGDAAGLDAAIARIMALAPEEVAAMSARGASGAHPLGTTPEGWIDGLEGHYARLLRT